MKHFLPLCLLLVSSSAVCQTAQAKPTNVPVAFRSNNPVDKGRHITMTSMGGLWLGSKVLAQKQIFVLTDLNGGALADGDKVHLSTRGDRPTYWQEDGKWINRTGDKPGAKSVFQIKWRQKNKSVVLRTPSGKFVSGPGKGEKLVGVAKATDPTIVFELLKNPVAVKEEKKPAPAKKS